MGPRPICEAAVLGECNIYVEKKSYAYKIRGDINIFKFHLETDLKSRKSISNVESEAAELAFPYEHERILVRKANCTLLPTKCSSSIRKLDSIFCTLSQITW